MNRALPFGLVVCVFLACACSSSPKSTTGSGGSGGGATAGTGGTTTTSTATGATGGGTAGSGGATTGTGTDTCPTSGENVYDNSAVSGLPDCNHPVGPDVKEDGTFAVTIFGPFVSAFTFDSFTFAALQSDSLKLKITDPWTASVTVVPKGMDPTAVNPNDKAKPYPLVLLESLPSGMGTDEVKRYTVKLDTPLSVNACDTVVVALRNTRDMPVLDAPSTATMMCGAASTHSSTNQWWNLDGTMVPVSSFSKDFDRDWWVSLVPAK